MRKAELGSLRGGQNKCSPPEPKQAISPPRRRQGHPGARFQARFLSFQMLPGGPGLPQLRSVSRPGLSSVWMPLAQRASLVNPDPTSYRTEVKLSTNMAAQVTSGREEARRAGPGPRAYRLCLPGTGAPGTAGWVSLMNPILPTLIPAAPSNLAVGVSPCRRQRELCHQRVTGRIHLRGRRAVAGSGCHPGPHRSARTQRWLEAATPPPRGFSGVSSNT